MAIWTKYLNVLWHPKQAAKEARSAPDSASPQTPAYMERRAKARYSIDGRWLAPHIGDAFRRSDAMAEAGTAPPATHGGCLTRGRSPLLIFKAQRRIR